MEGGKAAKRFNPDSKKAVKARRDAAARKPELHSAGLGDEIEAASLAPSREKGSKKRSRAVGEDELLTQGLSNKILLQARKQRDEIEEEDERRCAPKPCRRLGLQPLPQR